MLNKEYLQAQGWIEKAGIMVRFSHPRIGWKPDGTLIIGYHEYPEKVTTIEQLQNILRNENSESQDCK